MTSISVTFSKPSRLDGDVLNFIQSCVNCTVHHLIPFKWSVSGPCTEGVGF